MKPVKLGKTKVAVVTQPPLQDVDRAFYGEAIEPPKHNPHCPACGRSTKKTGECNSCRKAGIEAGRLFHEDPPL